MSKFLKISNGIPRQATVLGTDLGSGAASATQFLAADGSGNSAFRSLLAGDIPSLAATYLPLTGGTMSGAINHGGFQATNAADPTSAQSLATKNYVDNVASGLNPKQGAYAATIGSNISGAYSNGAAGVGATFTVTATGVFTLDGVTPPVNSRILLKDQSSAFQNGIYDLTTAGSVGVSPVLTRSLDYNTALDMNAGDLIPVLFGTVNQKTSWLQTATITTVGTDALTFVEWSFNPSIIVTTVGTYNSQTVNADGAVISGNSIFFQNADATHPGMVGTGAQTWAGQKTFSSAPIFSSLNTAGVLHTAVTTGLVSTSLIVAADVTTNTLTNATLAQMGAATIKGNNAAGTANAADLSVAQVLTMLGIRSGVTALSAAAVSKAITFSTAFAGTGYSITANLINTTDTNPEFQAITITAQSTSGFTASWNAALDTANYSLSWQAILSN